MAAADVRHTRGAAARVVLLIGTRCGLRRRGHHHPRRYDEANDEWVLNGTKTWATNGGIANVHIVVASGHPELGRRGQATFIIPPNTPGFKQGQKFKKHGIRASHTAEVVLDDVRSPAA